MKHGRKSSASLSVVAGVTLERIDPPADLTGPQSEVWRSVVASKPPDWFTSGNAPLLSAYCRAVVEHLRVSGLIDAFNTECLTEQDESDLARYDRLIRIQDRLVRQMMSLATKMRVTQQSVYGARAAATASEKAGTGTKARPWQPAVIEG